MDSTIIDIYYFWLFLAFDFETFLLVYLNQSSPSQSIFSAISLTSTPSSARMSAYSPWICSSMFLLFWKGSTFGVKFFIHWERLVIWLLKSLVFFGNSWLSLNRFPGSNLLQSEYLWCYSIHLTENLNQFKRLFLL